MGTRDLLAPFAGSRILPPLPLPLPPSWLCSSLSLARRADGPEDEIDVDEDDQEGDGEAGLSGMVDGVEPSKALGLHGSAQLQVQLQSRFKTFKLFDLIKIK